MTLSRSERAVPQLRTYEVFISHAWRYSEDYYRVVGFLDDAPNFRWSNRSVPEHDPAPTYEHEYDLRGQTRDVDVFLIIAGMYAAHSGWIDFELAFARRIGCPVLGIRKWGGERIPLAISNATREIVGWQGSSIVSAIRRHAL